MQGVECRICGKELPVMNHLHLRVHGLSVAAYRIMFPTARIMSLAMRAKLSEHSRRQWANPDSPIRRSRAAKKVPGEVKMRATRRVQGKTCVECRICGKEQGSISYRHLRSHGITAAAYMSLFPDAPLCSEATRAKLSETSRRAWSNPTAGFHQGRGIKIWATRRARGTSSGTLKGKTYEEIHGVEKARELKALRKASRYWEQISPEVRQAVNAINSRKAWDTPERARRTAAAQNRKPSVPEVRFGETLEREFPSQWKYVGDGEVWIGGKNPDFINIDGHKLLIEAYTPYFKIKDFGTIENFMRQRSAHFRTYGFQTIFVNLYEDWQPAITHIRQLQEGEKESTRSG